MLLAMLITILTMVFNSSSIAWSTGKASVAEMDEIRQKMSESKVANQVWGSMRPDLDIQRGKTGKGEWVRKTGNQLWTTLKPGNVNISGGTKEYVVGVWSLGPDGRPNSGDDISTWPDVQ